MFKSNRLLQGDEHLYRHLCKKLVIDFFVVMLVLRRYTYSVAKRIGLRWRVHIGRTVSVTYVRPNPNPNDEYCTWTRSDLYISHVNNFHFLFSSYSQLKKKFPSAELKLPGKKLFGNNFDPEFIKQRREGLHDFIQKILGNTKIIQQ